MQPTYFSSLTTELARRTARATLSQMGMTSAPLRDHLRDLFDQAAGVDGSFLAEPVFESMFGWEPAELTMSDLAGNVLEAELVRAMDQPPKALKAEYRFNR